MKPFFQYQSTRNKRGLTWVVGIGFTALLVCWFAERPEPELIHANPLAQEGWEVYADWEQGMAAWSAGHFPEAVAAFVSHLDAWPEHSKGHYYLALSQLELGEDRTAIPHLQIARLNDTLLYYDATWHLALAYLKTEQVSDAIALLEELYQGQEPLYRQKADVMLHQWLYTSAPSEGIQ